MKALLDTCIIIDVLQNREPFREASRKLFIAAASDRFEGFITAKSVTDIYYLTHRILHSDKDTRVIINKLYSLFGVLDTSGIDCQKALLSQISDYEDAVMTETAIRYGMDYIVTRNEKDYSGSTIPVCSPAEFLAKISD